MTTAGKIRRESDFFGDGVRRERGDWKLDRMLESGEWGVGSGEWGVGSGEWGVVEKILLPTPHSPFPIPHSPLPILLFLEDYGVFRLLAVPW